MAAGAVDSSLQERQHRWVGCRRPERAHEAVCGEVAGELVVVEQQPTQYVALLGLVAAREAPALARKVHRDHARLRQPSRTHRQHRRFTVALISARQAASRCPCMKSTRQLSYGNAIARSANAP